MLIDTHAHLDLEELAQDTPAVLRRALAQGIAQIVTIGISLESSRRAVALAETYPGVYATVGIHPHGARVLDDGILDILRTLARTARVKAIGEIGLDFYRDRQPRGIQRRCLAQQLELACELALPVVFHVRDAFAAFFEVVEGFVPKLAGGVLHCFSGTWEVARRCLDWGFYVSIPGTVTYPKSQVQQEVVQRMPSDRILIETDAPFLAPVPYRGKTNEPAYLVHTARKVAELRGSSLQLVARQTTDNGRRLFGIAEEDFSP